MEPDDKLGRNVCKFCAEKIYNFYEFRLTFLDSQRQLENYYVKYGKDANDDDADKEEEEEDDDDDNEDTEEHPSDEPTIWQCDKCPKTFNRNIELRLHKHIHVEPENGFDDTIDIKTEPYDDEYDEYDTTNASEPMNETMDSSTNNNGEEYRWRCTTCGMSFLRRAHLRTHRRQHPVRRDKLATSTSKSTVKKSIQTTPKVKLPVFTNSVASSSNGFDSVSSFMGNESFDDARWKCKKCPGVFRTRRLLRDHNSTHRNSMPATTLTLAPLSPPSAVSTPIVKQSLIIPDTDPTELRWKCSKCRKAFQTRKLLQKHRTTHRFEIKLHLKTKALKPTMKRERTDRDWLCNICGASFKRRSMLRDHRRYEHAIQGANASLLLEPDVEIKTEGLPMIEIPN